MTKKKYSLGSLIKDSGKAYLDIASNPISMLIGKDLYNPTYDSNFMAGVANTMQIGQKVGMTYAGIPTQNIQQEQTNRNTQVLGQSIPQQRASFAQGGSIKDRILNSLPNGSTHESSPYGGIPIGKQSLVEKGESILDIGGEKYVFSDRIKPDKKSQSFAKLAERIKSKYKRANSDEIEKKDMQDELIKLAGKQEEFKMSNSLGEYAYGGMMKHDGLTGTSSINENLLDEVSINANPPVKSIGLGYTDIANYLYNSSSPPNPQDYSEVIPGFQLEGNPVSFKASISPNYLTKVNQISNRIPNNKSGIIGDIGNALQPDNSPSPDNKRSYISTSSNTTPFSHSGVDFSRDNNKIKHNLKMNLATTNVNSGLDLRNVKDLGNSGLVGGNQNNKSGIPDNAYTQGLWGLIPGLIGSAYMGLTNKPDYPKYDMLSPETLSLSREREIAKQQATGIGRTLADSNKGSSARNIAAQTAVQRNLGEQLGSSYQKEEVYNTGERARVNTANQGIRERMTEMRAKENAGVQQRKDAALQTLMGSFVDYGSGILAENRFNKHLKAIESGGKYNFNQDGSITIGDKTYTVK
jgi:hypothetical protein